MKNILLLILLLSLVSIIKSNLEDEGFPVQDILLPRIDRSHGISEAKIKIEVHLERDEQECLARTDLNKGEIIYQVTKDYVITSFDLFPFKIEIGNILNEYYEFFLKSKTLGKNILTTDPEFLIINLLSIQTLFYSKYDKNSEFRNLVTKTLDENMFDDYIKFMATPHQIKLSSLIIDSFGNNIEIWEPEDHELFKLAGVLHTYTDNIKHVVDFLRENLQRNQIVWEIYKDIIVEKEIKRAYGNLRNHINHMKADSYQTFAKKTNKNELDGGASHEKMYFALTNNDSKLFI